VKGIVLVEWKVEAALQLKAIKAMLRRNRGPSVKATIYLLSEMKRVEDWLKKQMYESQRKINK